MLLFLDVDGPLIPFGAADRAYPVYDGPSVPAADAPWPPGPRPAAPSPVHVGHPLLARVDPALGPRLAGLGCELVWATTWMDEANAALAPWLGLPELPVVQWPDEDEPPGPLHWKTRPLVAWAAGRPFIWVDDEITGADRSWTAAHHPGPALLHRVDHRYGLTEGDFRVLEDWLAAV